jgi:hypothetical protein
MFPDGNRQCMTEYGIAENKAESSEFSKTGIFKGKETTTMEEEADKMGG